MSFLLLQTGGTDNLLLQIGDDLLLQVTDAAPSAGYQICGTLYLSPLVTGTISLKPLVSGEVQLKPLVEGELKVGCC